MLSTALTIVGSKAGRIALAVGGVLLLLAIVFLRGFAKGKGAGALERAQQKLEAKDAQLKAAADRARNRSDLTDRMRDGRF